MSSHGRRGRERSPSPGVRPDDAPAGRRKGASLVPPTRPLVVTGKPVREPHALESPVPEIGPPFGERGEETYPRDSAWARLRKRRMPPTPYRLAPLLDST